MLFMFYGLPCRPLLSSDAIAYFSKILQENEIMRSMSIIM